MFRLKKSSKRGFTLLETMLSVAILLIVTLIAYEGFMSTLNYAGDTALAERVSNENAGSAYQKVADRTQAASKTAGTTTLGIQISGTDIEANLQVTVFTETAGLSHFSPTSLMSDANFCKTANRHGFAYLARECPTHHCELQYFKGTVDGNTVVIAKCKHKDADGHYDCDYQQVV